MTTPKKKGRSSCKSTVPTTRAKSTGNSTEAQLARLLDALVVGPMTTLEIRRDLDILGVAPRIFDLRHKRGKNIVMTWVDRPSDSGQMHRVALYTLMPDAPDLFDAFRAPVSPTHLQAQSHVI
jgi:hypothetical protein